jgi:hypothetical protein
MKNHEQRRPEGNERIGGHQEGLNSVQGGQTQRRARSAPEQAPKTGRSTKGNKRSTSSSSTGNKV